MGALVLRNAWLVRPAACDHTSSLAARRQYAFLLSDNALRQQARMIAFTTALQQTPHGRAPILDTARPPTNRTPSANALATTLQDSQPPTTNQPRQDDRPMCTTRIHHSPSCGHTWYTALQSNRKHPKKNQPPNKTTPGSNSTNAAAPNATS